MIKMTIRPVAVNGVALPQQEPSAVKFFERKYQAEMALDEIDRNWKKNACGKIGDVWGTTGMSCTITKGTTTYQVDVMEVEDK